MCVLVTIFIIPVARTCSEQDEECSPLSTNKHVTTSRLEEPPSADFKSLESQYLKVLASSSKQVQLNY